MTSRLILISTILCFLLAPAAGAQTPESTETEVDAQATTAAQPAATPADESVSDDDVIRRLHRLVVAHPEELSAILRLDPSLLSNAEFLAKYPELAAFLAEYPRVARNPRLYVDRAGLPALRQPVTETAAAAIAETIGIMFTVLIIVFSVIWLIRTFVEQRRWSRLARVQAEVHGKLLDRFTSGEDLLRYMQSPAGARFLESAPIPVSTEKRSLGLPVSSMSMVWSLQLGIVIAAGSLGLLLVAGIYPEDTREIAAMGLVGLCVGIGFAASGIVSSILSKRFGLWPAEDAGRGTGE